MKNKNYALHIFALGVLFIFGNTIISMPTNVFNVYFLGFMCLISYALILLARLMIYLSPKSKIIMYALNISVLLLSVWGAVTTFADFITFLKAEQLPQASVMLLSTVLIAVTLAFVYSSDLAVYKYGLLVALIAVVFVVICFAGGISVFNFSSVKSTLTAPQFSVMSFIKYFLPVAVLPFFINYGKTYAKSLRLGIAAGFTGLLLCVMQVALTFGDISRVAYPYLKAVGVLSSGSLFTRLDGFIYFVFFVTSLIKITICTKVARSYIIQIIFPRRKVGGD
ncbi:MAG: hypothetical protein E7521_03660 [Ruminococcaceae bacterium]|nr:hypothetical protein [Oscillospiraceae bacterium]